ncbi:unnamed protein product [Brachionus calyciflorus]|uniref:RING-type domain-containing protein n=1 Tax=Brachionus calyciflorus TaxID=104777 RepID=A0A814BYX8_9BILA|nr:unnamed protein product [Brachionus calyciflorus]
MFDIELLTCPSCNKIYNSPRFLPCGETICTNCIEQGNSFKCKFCESDHCKPETEFPINKRIQNKLDSLWKTVSNDDNLKKLNDSLEEIKNEFEHFQTSLQQSETKIIDYCRSIVNKIDLKAEEKIREINEIRDRMIKRVLNYEQKCLTNLKTHLTEINDFAKEIDELSNEKSHKLFDLYVNSKHLDEIVLKIETFRSIFAIEKIKNDDIYFENEILELKNNELFIDEHILGKIKVKRKKIQLSDYDKVPLRPLFYKNPRKNFKIEKLDDENILIFNIVSANKISVEIWKNFQHKKTITLNMCYYQSLKDIDVKTNLGYIYILIKAPGESMFIKYDFELNEIDRQNLAGITDFFLITNQYIVIFNKFNNLNSGRAYLICDFNLNLLISAHSNQFNLRFNKVSYDSSGQTQIVSNEKYHVFISLNSLNIITREADRLIKTVPLKYDLLVHKLTNENVLIGEIKNKMDSQNEKRRLVLVDLNGKIRDEYCIDTFPDHFEVILDKASNGTKFEFIDLENFKLYKKKLKSFLYFK